jgi:predicted nucleic acid-binding Zn ribbon protein
MESMREVLRESLGRSLRTMEPLDRLRVAWPVACGVAMARKGMVAGLENGVLWVEVADSAWLEQMTAMRAVLQNELARIAEVKLGGIHFYRAASSR